MTEIVYCRQTKRKLKARIYEHENALTRIHIHSQVAEHAFQTKHDINWSKTKLNITKTTKEPQFFSKVMALKKLNLKIFQ